jgi:hypothetical protein
LQRIGQQRGKLDVFLARDHTFVPGGRAETAGRSCGKSVAQSAPEKHKAK